MFGLDMLYYRGRGKVIGNGTLNGELRDVRFTEGL